MSYRRTFGLTTLIAVLASTAPAFANPSAPVELSGYVKLEKVTTDAAGESRVERVDPEVVVPGDRLIFGTRFANRGAVPIERFVVSNPVPASVSVASDIDEAMLVSVDGGKAWGRLGDLSITDAAGQQRAAMPRDVTHVRWVIAQIAPGESGELEFPVTVR